MMELENICDSYKIAVEIDPINKNIKLLTLDELDYFIEKKFEEFKININYNVKQVYFEEKNVINSANNYYNILKKTSEVSDEFKQIAYELYSKYHNENPDSQAFEGIDFSSFENFVKTSSSYGNFTLNDIENVFIFLSKKYVNIAYILLTGILNKITNKYFENDVSIQLANYKISTPKILELAVTKNSSFKFMRPFDRVISSVSCIVSQNLFFQWCKILLNY
uniref:Uncharacterized protein n=1 Tax=viral metagenome TaxID=1070528 RepID=A0A6C0E851_9ZZZZ